MVVKPVLTSGIKPVKRAKKDQVKKEKIPKIFLQYEGIEYDYEGITNQVKTMWLDSGKKIGDIDNLELYIKPEESKAYYVINLEFSGNIDL